MVLFVIIVVFLLQNEVSASFKLSVVTSTHSNSGPFYLKSITRNSTFIRLIPDEETLQELNFTKSLPIEYIATSDFSKFELAAPIPTLKVANHWADESMRLEVQRASILNPVKLQIVYRSPDTFNAKNPIFAEWHGRLLMAWFIAPGQLTNTTGGVHLAWLKEGNYSEISQDTIFGIGPDFMVPKVKFPHHYHEDPRIMPMSNGSLLVTYSVVDGKLLHFLKAILVIHPVTQKVEIFHSILAQGDKNYLPFEFSHDSNKAICGHHNYHGMEVNLAKKIVSNKKDRADNNDKKSPAISTSSNNNRNGDGTTTASPIIIESKLEDDLYGRKKRHLRGTLNTTNSHSTFENYSPERGLEGDVKSTVPTAGGAMISHSSSSAITNDELSHVTSIYYIRQIHPLHIIEVLTHFDANTGALTYSHKDIVKSTDNFVLPLHQRYYQGGLRGSSPPILINGVLFSFFHTKTTVPYAGMRHTYFMGAITFCPTFPFNIHSISEHPILTPSLYDGPWFNKYTDYVVYPTGVVLDADGEHMFVSAGYNDIYMMVFKLNVDEVFDSLVHVADC